MRSWVPILFWLCFGAAFGQAHHSIATLISQLRNPNTCEHAEAELERIGVRDRAVRNALSAKLPKMLAERRSIEQLRLLARLAGQLRIITTIPELGALLEQNNEDLLDFTLYQFMSLKKDAFGLALVCMGEAAVPELSKHLESPNSKTRSRAARALLLIDSPHARSILATHLGHEGDGAIAAMIRENLHQPTKKF